MRVDSVLIGLADGMTIVRRRVSDRQRRADRQLAREPDDVRVAQPDAAVRDRARDQVRAVGAVDADVAAAGPVGQRRRARAGAERDRAVERAAVAREPVADDELAARRRARRARRCRPGRAGPRARRGAASAGAWRGRRRAACGPCRRRRARRAAPSPSCRSGAREPDADPQRHGAPARSGRTMFVVASGVRARSVPTAARAERSGRARATTSRRTAAHVVSPRWRVERHGRPDRERRLRGARGAARLATRRVRAVTSTDPRGASARIAASRERPPRRGAPGRRRRRPATLTP